jgi:galactitol-specific phosphotransferase system IIC component
MLFIGIIGVVIIGALSLLGGDSKEKVMNDFCNLECKQNIQKKYTFCC